MRDQQTCAVLCMHACDTILCVYDMHRYYNHICSKVPSKSATLPPITPISNAEPKSPSCAYVANQ